MRRYTILGLLWAALSLVGVWFLDHTLFDWFVRYLESAWKIKEADLIASISSFVIPCIISAAIIYLVYWFFRREHELKISRVESPNMSIGVAIDYIVNDSKAVLKQPREPWVAEFGPGKGQRFIEKGVEHSDALTKFNERLISGELKIWGLRQMPVTHVANQFEHSVREIPKEYWDRMQLNFLSCFHQTNTIPQTTPIPGRQADLQWTGLMVIKEQVLRAWPPKSRWQRFLRWIMHKQRITYW
jgi:hypothetical protein